MPNMTNAEIEACNPYFKSVFGQQLGDMPRDVRTSWLRCISEHGLEPDRIADSEVLSHVELVQRRAPVEELSAVCLPEMDRLLKRLGDYAEVVMLSDAKGVVVQYRSNASVIDKCSGLRILPGSVWTEEQQGTTGIGLCIREQRPLSVVMNEHFSTKLTSLSCTVAPIFGEEGQLAAVLNVTSMQNTSRALQSVMRELIISSARRIENVYFDRRHLQSRVLKVSRYDDFSDAAVEARLAIDDAGRIIDATPAARDLLISKNNIDNKGDLFGRKLSSLAGVNDLERWIHSESPVIGSEQGSLHFRLNDAHRRNAAVKISEKITERQFSLQKTPKVDVGKFLPTLGDIAGTDSGMTDRLRIAQRLHARKIPLLLQGESGSGKTQLARALHEANSQSSRAFVTINCASIPRELIESELFGYRAGAFTGAAKQGAPGRLVMANGGTLFLDEIGDMPLALQGRLLQVLSEGEFVPVGAIEPVKVSFSLISASLRDLPCLVREGKFREDLFYRLSGASLVLPSLRTRADRIEIIEKAFERAGAEIELKDIELSEEARLALMHYGWPGNIRELQHAARFSVAMLDSSVIEVQCLPPHIRQPEDGASKSTNLAACKSDGDPASIVKTLERTGWNVSAAAQQLGISRATMHRRLIEFNIERPRGRNYGDENFHHH
jgi:transcriptional regulator of acetoin/glycerol metabolism